MKLTVNQAIEELKRINSDKATENNDAIIKRYGTLENSWKASAKMREFIIGCRYCSHCYEKQKSFDDLDCGMCNSCYDWEESKYLNSGI